MLTPNALTVLEKRYLKRDERGRIVETPEELFFRVAHLGEDTKQWKEKFHELIGSLRFLPNSPTLMNAGMKKGQLSACFVLPIEDSLNSIFNALKYAAKIHQSGGGTGFSFSRLRGKGSEVRSTHGVASGPISFMKIFDAATETIKQGGRRRGANMAILRIDHPDIEEFISCKLDFQSLVNFNISVGITREFMKALKEDSLFSLRDPHSGKVVQKISSQFLFDQIVKSAWRCGDPGVVFLDRINEFNPTPHVGEMESTNPCGEQPLLPYESCNLGSLNLSQYYSEGSFLWKRFQRDVHTAVRFLDNVIAHNHYPIRKCEEITLRNRKIGLGVMGFADLLLKQGISYASPKALEVGEEIMRVLDFEAKEASQELARERGAFPNWKGSRWEKLGMKKMRNATVSTVAPTGTISMIAGCSSGIEPLFAGIFHRNVLSGERLIDVHPSVAEVLERKQIPVDQVTEALLSEAIGPAWCPSHQVPVGQHVLMQAAFQKYSDSAVSKTINLPKEATEAQIEEAYLRAYELGCKGITVYRDQSRPTQVLDSSVKFCPTC